jgi:Kef-type K+ transport system membrane component KefB
MPYSFSSEGTKLGIFLTVLQLAGWATAVYFFQKYFIILRNQQLKPDEQKKILNLYTISLMCIWVLTLTITASMKRVEQISFQL